MLMAAIALTLSVAGIACLRHAWAHRTKIRPYAIAAGWIALGLAIPFWIDVLGAGPGTVLTLTAPSLVAYAAIAAGISIRETGRGRANGKALDPEARPRGMMRTIGRIVAAGPVAGAAAFLTGAAIAIALPAARIDAFALAAFTLPLVWGGLGAWSLADVSLPRVFIGQALWAAGFSLVIYVAGAPS